MLFLYLLRFEGTFFSTFIYVNIDLHHNTCCVIIQRRDTRTGKKMLARLYASRSETSDMTVALDVIVCASGVRVLPGISHPQAVTDYTVHTSERYAALACTQ